MTSISRGVSVQPPKKSFEPVQNFTTRGGKGACGDRREKETSRPQIYDNFYAVFPLKVRLKGGSCSDSHCVHRKVLECPRPFQGPLEEGVRITEDTFFRGERFETNRTCICAGMQR